MGKKHDKLGPDPGVPPGLYPVPTSPIVSSGGVPSPDFWKGPDPPLADPDQGPPLWRPVLAFNVPGSPIAMGRPRLSKRGVYMPKRTRCYVQSVADAARTAATAAGIEAIDAEYPLKLHAEFVFPRRVSDFARRYAGGRRLKTTRPDVDNLIKAIADGIQSSGVIYDDGQIAEVSAVKLFGAVVDRKRKRAEASHTAVTLYTMTTLRQPTDELTEIRSLLLEQQHHAECWAGGRIDPHEVQGIGTRGSILECSCGLDDLVTAAGLS